MYTKISIENFRCFEHLEVGPLARVNLITGANNVGKTALLEALYLHANFSRPAVFLHLNRWRGLVPGQGEGEDTGAASFLRYFPPASSARVTAETDDGKTWSLELRMSPRGGLAIGPPPPNERGETPQNEFTVSFGAGDDRQFSSTVAPDLLGSMDATATPAAAFLPSRDRFRPEQDIERLAAVPADRRDAIIAMGRSIEPGLERLAIRSPGPSVLYAEVEGSPLTMPVPLLGEGLGRLLSLALAVATTDSSLEGHRALFVDEIENGIYHKAMPDVWRGLAHAAREFDVQLFATTHSYECIRAAVSAFEQEGLEDDLALHRLDRLKDGSIKATTSRAPILTSAVDMNMEVR